MSIGPYVAGPVIVQVNLRDGNGLVSLGYSADGIQVSDRQHYGDIHSDRYGGQQGPPIDRQFFGRSAVIPLQLSEFEPVVARRLRNMLFGTPAGVNVVGCPLTADGKTFQVILTGSKDAAALVADANAETLTPLNYPNCFLEDPVDVPVGSKNTILGLNIVAHQWTSDTAQSGDGVTRLYLDRSTEVIADLAAYSAA